MVKIDGLLQERIEAERQVEEAYRALHRAVLEGGALCEGDAGELLVCSRAARFVELAKKLERACMHHRDLEEMSIQ